jgi:hypothetical protein
MRRNWALAAWALLALPPELLTFERLADELRVPIATKIRDMRSNYGLKELTPGRQWAFVSDDGEQELRILLSSRVSPGQDALHENVQFLIGPTVVYEETIDARGRGLVPSSVARRLVLDAAGGYGLRSDPSSGLEETEKTVQISAGKVGALRYRTSSSGSGPSRSVVTEMDVGGRPVLKFEDRQSAEPPMRTYTYSVLSSAFVFTLLNSINGTQGLPLPGIYRVKLERPPGYALDQVSYSINGKPYHSLDGFQSLFSSQVYETLIAKTVLQSMVWHVQDHFPHTERRQNAAQGGKLLEELTQLFTKLQAPSLSVADQIFIRNRILGYMDSVREGSIQDRR